MKPYFIIILLLCGHHAFCQTSDDITKNNIYKVNRVSIVTNKKGKNITVTTYKTTIYYDDSGRVTKGITYWDDRSEGKLIKMKQINLVSYVKDSLISQEKTSNFYNSKLDYTSLMEYDYIFDSIGRAIYRNTHYNNERRKDVYIYNSANQLDTVYYYTNDSSILTEAGTERGTIAANLSLKRITTYTYPKANTVVEKNCCYPLRLSESRCCRTIQKIYSDTLDVVTTRFRGSEGCLVDSIDTEQVVKTFKRNGNKYSVIDESGVVTNSQYRRNRQGLIILANFRRFSKAEGTTTTTVSSTYFYRPKTRTHNIALLPAADTLR